MEPNNQNSQEIDLSYLSKKTASFFDSIGYAIYNAFRFMMKNIIVLVILLIIGIVAGYLIDNQNKNNYKHEIIVIPNFNSTGYLYNKIENTKFQNEPIKSVEIKPIVDVYQFINEGYNNLEIAKYLSENNLQLTKYEEGSEVEKFYRYHLMTIYTNEKDENGSFVRNFLKELNEDKYFKERQLIEILNTEREIVETDSSIRDINKIIQKLGSPTEKTGDMNIEMYSEISNLFNGKKSLLFDYNKLKIKQIEQSKIIYDASIFLNIKINSFPMMILIPILLLFLFFVSASIIHLFKKYKKREQAVN